MILTKTEKTIGIVLAILLLLLTLSGSGYFFFTLKVNFVQWLAYNACSPSSLVYLAFLSPFGSPKRAFGYPLPSCRCTISALWDYSHSRGVAPISLPNCRISKWRSTCYGQATPFTASVITKDLHKVCCGVYCFLCLTSLLWCTTAAPTPRKLVTCYKWRLKMLSVLSTPSVHHQTPQTRRMTLIKPTLFKRKNPL